LDREACRNCSRSRGGAPVVKRTPSIGSGRFQDDWRCARCNTSNFANRDVCRQCNADKPITHHATGSRSGFSDEGRSAKGT